MTDTLFTFLKGAISNGDDTDPETSSVFYNPPMECKNNVTIWRRETISLQTAETRQITLPASVSGDWVCVMARVVGHAKLTTTGTDWDGSTPISGVTAGYGVPQHPGYISMVSTNVSTFIFTGLADNTEVEYLMAKLASDDQL